jgi:hypothetical protein
MLKKKAEADILANFEMIEEVFTKMEVRYKILCPFPSREKSINSWKHFRAL